MAYQMIADNDGFQVRCEKGTVTHIRWHQDSGNWSVVEDAGNRRFDNRGDALDVARHIGRDPDYLKLIQED